jgi:hypothetical protein
MLNLDLLPESSMQVEELSSSWDQLKLSTGQSVNNACLINSDLFVTVEHNRIRAWRTNLPILISDVEKVLSN